MGIRNSEKYIVLSQTTTMFAIPSRCSRSLHVRVGGNNARIKYCSALCEIQREDMIYPAVMLDIQPHKKTPLCKTIRIRNNNAGMLNIADVKAFCVHGQNRASTKNGAVVSQTWGSRQHKSVYLNPPCVIDNVTILLCNWHAGARLEMIGVDDRVFFNKLVGQDSRQIVRIPK